MHSGRICARHTLKFIPAGPRRAKMCERRAAGERQRRKEARHAQHPSRDTHAALGAEASPRDRRRLPEETGAGPGARARDHCGAGRDSDCGGAAVPTARSGAKRAPGVPEPGAGECWRQTPAQHSDAKGRSTRRCTDSRRRRGASCVPGHGTFQSEGGAHRPSSLPRAYARVDRRREGEGGGRECIRHAVTRAGHAVVSVP